MTNPAWSVLRFSHFAMSTTFELVVGGKDKTYASQCSQAVFDEIDRIEKLFNFYDPGSELSLINRLCPDRSLRIGVEMYECLNLAEKIRSETHGAFDINVRSLIKCKNKSDSIRENGKGLPIELKRSSEGFEIIFHGKNELDKPLALKLDLGGIGKGYALDRAVEILADWDVEQALIHGGTSSVLARGTAPDKPEGERGWPVGVAGGWKLPDAPRRVMLWNRSLSGSGKEVKGEHIINPASGDAAGGHEAAWVSSPTAATADALSTAFVVMHPDEVRQYCERHPEVWALVISDNKNYEIFNRDRILILE